MDTRTTLAPTAEKPYPLNLYVDGCAYCDREKETLNTFFPRHFAMSHCRSGRRNHCTCDGCF